MTAGLYPPTCLPIPWVSNLFFDVDLHKQINNDICIQGFKLLVAFKKPIFFKQDLTTMTISMHTSTKACVCVIKCKRQKPCIPFQLARPSKIISKISWADNIWMYYSNQQYKPSETPAHFTAQRALKTKSWSRQLLKVQVTESVEYLKNTTF